MPQPQPPIALPIPPANLPMAEQLIIEAIKTVAWIQDMHRFSASAIPNDEIANYIYHALGYDDQIAQLIIRAISRSFIFAGNNVKGWSPRKCR